MKKIIEVFERFDGEGKLLEKNVRTYTESESPDTKDEVTSGARVRYEDNQKLKTEYAVLENSLQDKERP